jgi:hypothetical protein
VILIEWIAGSTTCADISLLETDNVLCGALKFGSRREKSEACNRRVGPAVIKPLLMMCSTRQGF